MLGLKYIVFGSVVIARQTLLTTSQVQFGCAAWISPAVVLTYTGAHKAILAGNAALLIVHINNIFVVCQSLAASIHNHKGTSQLVVAASASANNHSQAVASRYTKSHTTKVAQAVPAQVIQLHFSSALPAGSNSIQVFSHRIIYPVMVHQASESFESHIALVALALGIVSSLALTELKSESIANAAISHQVALPTTVCSPIVNDIGVLSEFAFSMVFAS